jgi:hypothetical protein
VIVVPDINFLTLEDSNPYCKLWLSPFFKPVCMDLLLIKRKTAPGLNNTNEKYCKVANYLIP